MISFLNNQLRLRFALMVLLSWAFYSAAAGACMICFPYPETTIADILIQSKTVVLARERNDKPYTFFALEVLKGSTDGIGFNAFIDATSRRVLRQNPEDAVVFRRMNTESDWQYIAYADLDYQEFIRSLLEQSIRWQKFGGNANRIDFFAKHLTHSDRKIREQAYLEIGRAPYASIKHIAATVPRQQIRALLGKWRFIEWHSLYIIMLGQSRHPDDLGYIRKQLESAAAHGLTTNLSAWVTAFIETNPETGVEEIENMYFSNKSRTQDELREVCKGLSVLGSESSSRFAPELVKRKHRIVRSYGSLLENHPLMAGPVAKDLTVWQIGALVDQLTQIRKKMSVLDPDTTMAITYYLSVSHRFPHIETYQ